MNEEMKQEAMRLGIEAENYEYVKSMETSMPIKPGMYLKLLHGRKSPDADLDDWGDDGPFIGPLEFCHVTHLSSINIAKAGDIYGTGPMTSETDVMYFHKDRLHYDGMYYGDFEFVMEKGDGE